MESRLRPVIYLILSLALTNFLDLIGFELNGRFFLTELAYQQPVVTNWPRVRLI